VVVPIEPVPFDEARQFVKAVCRSVERTQPERFTTERAVARRGDRVYLDAVQNGRGRTLPSPYSLRAVPGACVSAPVTWEELRGGVTPDRFTLRAMQARMEDAGDLFAPVYALRQRLP
jgi:bifunctional non-homologous end joining protein LigD